MMLERELVHDDKRQKLMSSRCPTLIEATLQLDDATHQQYLREQTKAAAEYSLECYQRKTDVKYTRLQPLNSNGFYRMATHVVHVNFTAMKDDGSEIIEYFFSEVTYDQLFETWQVRSCVTFDPADETSIANHCSVCSKRYTSPILHPAGSYVLGQYDEDDYVDFTYDYDKSDDEPLSTADQPPSTGDFWADDSDPEFFLEENQLNLCTADEPLVG